jgi:thiamine-monophosphate kinase
LGLQLLEREKRIFNDSPEIQPELMGYDYVLERHLKPEARFDILKNLSDVGIKPTAMIDISDGLSSEILHISKQSGTGCRIYTNKIPLAEETKQIAEEFGLEPYTIALNGGEDYELLFTVGLNDYEKIENVRGISIIGHVTDKSEGCYLINSDGSAIEINALGWDGFNR